MAIEIERKFLVNSEKFKSKAKRSFIILQGFLNKDPERTVRVRIKANKGILTVKGLSTDDGLKRFEWEKEIELKDAEKLLELCEEFVIKKERFEVEIEDHIFEIDVFTEENRGLILAEIELENADQDFPKPPWLGKEVTGDIKYYNSQLSINPYCSWEH